MEMMVGDTQGNFNPKKTLTRAEATAIINRLRNIRIELDSKSLIDYESINGYVYNPNYIIYPDKDAE